MPIDAHFLLWQMYGMVKKSFSKYTLLKIIHIYSSPLPSEIVMRESFMKVKKGSITNLLLCPSKDIPISQVIENLNSHLFLFIPPSHLPKHPPHVDLGKAACKGNIIILLVKSSWAVFPTSIIPWHLMQKVSHQSNIPSCLLTPPKTFNLCESMGSKVMSTNQGR